MKSSLLIPKMVSETDDTSPATLVRSYLPANHPDHPCLLHHPPPVTAQAQFSSIAIDAIASHINGPQIKQAASPLLFCCHLGQQLNTTQHHTIPHIKNKTEQVSSLINFSAFIRLRRIASSNNFTQTQHLHVTLAGRLLINTHTHTDSQINLFSQELPISLPASLRSLRQTNMTNRPIYLSK